MLFVFLYMGYLLGFLFTHCSRCGGKKQYNTDKILQEDHKATLENLKVEPYLFLTWVITVNWSYTAK